MAPGATPTIPLREPTFFILLSLAEGKKHGYAILKDVEHLSQGKIHLSTGTLYEALSRLLDLGWIERVPDGSFAAGLDVSDADLPAGRARKAYLLTGAGRELLRAEMDRLQGLVRLAQLRLNENGL